jgi:hypothetical protein
MVIFKQLFTPFLNFTFKNCVYPLIKKKETAENP